MEIPQGLLIPKTFLFSFSLFLFFFYSLFPKPWAFLDPFIFVSTPTSTPPFSFLPPSAANTDQHSWPSSSTPLFTTIIDLPWPPMPPALPQSVTPPPHSLCDHQLYRYHQVCHFQRPLTSFPPPLPFAEPSDVQRRRHSTPPTLPFLP